MQDSLFDRKTFYKIDKNLLKSPCKRLENLSKLTQSSPTLKKSVHKVRPHIEKEKDLALEKYIETHFKENGMRLGSLPSYKDLKDKDLTSYEPNIKNIKEFLTKNMKKFNSQEKLELLKPPTKVDEKDNSDSFGRSRFNFYYVNEKIPKSQTKNSNLKNINDLRKYNDNFQRNIDKNYSKKSQEKFVFQHLNQPTKTATDSNWFKTESSYRSNFTKFTKINQIEHNTLNPLVTVRSSRVKTIEDEIGEKEKTNRKNAHDDKKEKNINKNSLYKYLKIFNELHKKTQELMDSNILANKEASMSIEVDGNWQEKNSDYETQSKTILDYSHMKNKRVLLSVLKESFPNVLLRRNDIGDRILKCLNINTNLEKENLLPFEKFHNFARFALFYDATFAEMVEFVIYYLTEPNKNCAILEFKSKIKDLMLERYPNVVDQDKAIEKLMEQFELCKIIEKDAETVNFGNFRIVYGAKKLNIIYLMDLIMNKK